MGIKPGPDGYGAVTKSLHWATFLAMVAQFVIGYAMDRADDLLEVVVDRWFGGEPEGLLVVHVALGAVILVLATARLAWRRVAGLPPWAPGLTTVERRLSSAVEKALYTLMFAVPITGFGLVLVSGEDWDTAGGEWTAPLEWADDGLLLGAHIATHVVFFTTFALHLGLVLKHQFVDRDGLLRRMT